MRVCVRACVRVFAHVTGCSASCIQYKILRMFSLASMALSLSSQPCFWMHACVFRRTAHIKLNINVLNILH